MPEVPVRSAQYGFADLSLDVGRARLLRGETVIPLGRLTFALLRVLVEEAPNYVTHDELGRRVWGPRRVVTPENLTQQIKLLRRALNDNARQPTYVEVLRGHGYRLIPAVSRITRAALPAATTWDPATPSVAVLPFENMSPDPAHAYFASGFHDELLHHLARTESLRVIARTSVQGFAGTRERVSEIAAALGVQTVMEGSVRYHDRRVRIVAQLIDAATEAHLWSEVYERDLADAFAIQQDIAARIAAALRDRLSAPEVAPDTARVHPEAYAHYLQAIALSHQGGVDVSSPSAVEHMRVHLDRAIATDPGFAPPTCSARD